MHRSLLALLVPCLLSLAPASNDPQLTDGQLAPLAESLADYGAARAAGSGTEEARAKLEQTLEAVLGKKSPLREVAAIGRALWLSQDYERTKLRKGKIESVTTPAGTLGAGSLHYAYRVPRDYDPEKVSYTLVLAIPGEGEDPADHIRTHWSASEFRDGAIVVSPGMPEELRDWDSVMVRGRPGGLSHLMTCLRIASEQFAIDFDRVYVAGHGKSVPAALAAGNYSPHRFAGVIGRAGDAGTLLPSNFSNLPTLFVSAGANARDFQKVARESGWDNCELSPTGKEQDVWKWMLSKPRRTYPTEVRLVVGQPFPTRAYWLRVNPLASEASATGTIDRKTNTIRIECEGVAFLTLYLNDELIDLSRPVTVVRNKVETIESIARGLSITLDLLAEGTSDSAMVYVAQPIFDMRSESTDAGGKDSPGDAEFQDRLKVAAGDVEKLWQLHLWCLKTVRESANRAVLNRIVRLEPAHTEARAALGHHASGGQWFTSAAALERYRRSQDPVFAAERGYVKHREIWMHADERPFASKGLVKDQETGIWLSAADRRKLAEGWVRQDLSWIAPDDVARVDDGYWLVDGEWLELAEANRRHSNVERMWTIPTADVLLYTTVERGVASRALSHMSRALDDLRRVFGAEPVLPLQVAVLNDEEQYDRFAFGDPDGKRPATHAGRLHVLHSAYFAESWFKTVDRKSRFNGMGVCYWNTNAPYGDAYGVHSARLAVGLSYVEALDPSPKTVRRAESKGIDQDYYKDYQAEKQLPAWLRLGGAVYAERYFRDDSVAQDGDPWWARKWSLENLRGRGGMRRLEAIFECALDPDNPEDGLKLMIEAGLVVAFMLDAECAPVTAAHDSLKQALRAGSVSPKQIEALEQALLANQAKLLAFAGA